KLNALGEAYCVSKKTRRGGTFGDFKLEPEGNDTNQSEKNYEIVDSSKDEASGTGGSPSAGYTAFMSGFRWTHHLYCDE
ncbi:MAG: hypothetical protein H0V66_11040, partial [Bdellovibrionales bacterium]|nr:hypothetical protein [Bdellovibrionales bacterium]